MAAERLRQGRGPRLALLLALAALAGSPAPAQEVGTATPDCIALAAERADVAARHKAVKRDISDIAFGRNPRKKKGKVRGEDIGRGAAGAAAGVLLPFPLGVLVNAGAGASRRKGGSAAADPWPDVPALIEEQRALEARLAEIDAADCT